MPSPIEIADNERFSIIKLGMVASSARHTNGEFCVRAHLTGDCPYNHTYGYNDQTTLEALALGYARQTNQNELRIARADAQLAQHEAKSDPLRVALLKAEKSANKVRRYQSRLEDRVKRASLLGASNWAITRYTHLSMADIKNITGSEK